MADSARIVVHYLDGKVIKGTSQDFNPARPIFHLIPATGGPAIDVQCKLLKAVFFVKSLTGDPKRQDLGGFIAAPAATSQGKKLAIRFKDGELLCGYTLSHRPDREGFFLFPADAQSNNERIYVLNTAALEVKAGPAAEALARDSLAAAGKQ